MKNYLSLALLACFIITSCTKDKGSLTLTFTKSTAEYGNLEEIRNTELLEASRAIENPGKIYIGEEYLLIGEEGIGIHVYDNSAPANPVNVAFMNVPFCKEDSLICSKVSDIANSSRAYCEYMGYKVLSPVEQEEEQNKDELCYSGVPR